MNNDKLLKLISSIESDIIEITEFLADEKPNTAWAMYYLGSITYRLDQIHENFRKKINSNEQDD